MEGFGILNWECPDLHRVCKNPTSKLYRRTYRNLTGNDVPVEHLLTVAHLRVGVTIFPSDIVHETLFAAPNIFSIGGKIPS